MNNAAPKAIAVNKAVNDVIRNDRGRLMAGLVSRLGDFQLAEDALQDAAISALKHWGRSGIPDNPTAWLMKASFNKGIDRIRKSNREGQKAKDLSLIIEDKETMHASEEIPDERLRLIFTCCHPRPRREIPHRFDPTHRVQPEHTRNLGCVSGHRDHHGTASVAIQGQD